MNAPFSDHLSNREWMASALAGEIFGPGRFPGWKNDLYSEAQSIEPFPGMVFESDDFYLKRLVRMSTAEEILKEEPPSKRYGVGLLFPKETGEEFGTDMAGDEESELSEANEEVLNLTPEDASDEELTHLRTLVERGGKLLAKGDPENPDETDSLGLARLRRPRSMGVTFAVDSTQGPLKVEISGSRYRGVEVKVKSKKAASTEKDGGTEYSKKIWVRVPLRASLNIDPALSDGFSKTSLVVEHEAFPELAPLTLVVDVRVRSKFSSEARFTNSARLITVTLVNDTQGGSRAKEEEILFQCRFSVSPEDKAAKVFLPLPRTIAKADLEEQSLALLYRNLHTFAIGHGCAGDWDAVEGCSLANAVVAEPLPAHETPPVTPDMVYPKGHSKAGQKLVVHMLPLAEATDGWMGPLIELAALYETWISNKRSAISGLQPQLQAVASLHMDAADACLARIRKGLKLLEDNAQAALAFRLTNEAVLLQQIAGGVGLRSIVYDKKLKKLEWDKDITKPSINHSKSPERTWRPFQIAFLLMSLPGLWDGQDSDREIADLIWFPTGGGKTEAYLGATAFYLLARRLQDSANAGTGVIMRYTLRLLTSQQFQRAAGLICALEVIRRRELDDKKQPVFGESQFGIGIWVGGTTTPNNHGDSIDAYRAAEGKGPEAYQHVMLRCPWCGSEMGPLLNPVWRAKPKFICHGLRLTSVGTNRKVLLHCPDNRCDFASELPIEVVDQGIYKVPPSLIIGTVDKFAMLAWQHEGRSIFGIDDEGQHQFDPPGLIIQDELHLITGPLGSMVGLYEGVIEELCTRRSKSSKMVLRPKLVASTATTRASTRQIRDLYARKYTAVFPPPGLDADDSFFASYDRDAEGKIKPGRMYLGVLARAFGSGLTVNVRVCAALLAAAKLIPEDKRDPWHSLLVFYNALRELGAGLTLFGADIPERLGDLRDRWTPGQKRRYLNHVLELTGRLENSEVPAALKALERKFPQDKKVVDACLASNIIEVGVDVPRLGLMAVSGQPKNTAQYIQATGRVGRERPGLVVMLYDNRKARDLSHYEHFRDYHGRLYAQVEPSSVTPFTVQVLERALHGAFLAWVRNCVPIADQADPRQFHPKVSMIRQSLNRFGDFMRARVRFLFEDDLAARDHALTVFERILKRRLDEWDAVTNSDGARLAVCWKNKDLTGDSGDMPLLRYYGEPCKGEWIPYTWPTPTSMRGVDAECPAAMVTDIDSHSN